MIDAIEANRDALAAEWTKVSTAYPPPVSPKDGPIDPRESMSLGEWTVHELRARDAEIDRLNARIETMHAERMAFAEQMNAELDRLRDALVRRGAGYWP